MPEEVETESKEKSGGGRVIRGTRNESISTAAKNKTTNPGANHKGTLSQGYEHVAAIADGATSEQREAFTANTSLYTALPSSAFNGTYE